MAKIPDRFVTIAEAVRLTGVSRGQLQRWAKSDPNVKTAEGERGKTVWLPDVLAKVGDRDPDYFPEDDDDEGEDGKGHTPQVFGQLVRALSIANQHVVSLLEPTRKMGETYTSENTALRARIAELEAKLLEMLATHERQLTDEHNRRLQEEREKREAARLDKALEQLLQYAPAAIAGVAGHFGVQNVQEAVLVNAVTKLSDEQIAMLIHSRVLAPEALAVIDRVRATNRKTNGTTSQSNNGPPAGHPSTNTTESRSS